MKQVSAKADAWPEAIFSKPPSHERAIVLADEIAVNYLDFTVEDICKTVGLHLQYRRLSSSLGAFTVPADRGSQHNFITIVDPEKYVTYKESTLDRLTNQVGVNFTTYIDFVLGHELGHTFFYRPNKETDYPKSELKMNRTWRSSDRTDEEVFCDVFSARLITQRFALRERIRNPHQESLQP